MKNILSIIVVSAALTGCTSLNRTQRAADLDAKIESRLKAEITVDMKKRLTGQASSSTLFGFLQISGPNKFADGVFASGSGGLLSFLSAGDGLKAAAAYNATKGGNEVIVAPQYTVETKNFVVFSTTTVKVSGYSGTIQKIE